MPRLLSSSKNVRSRATIELNSKEVCIVSVAEAGVVVVRAYRANGFLARLVGSFIGPVLYREKNVYAATKTAAVLAARFPEQSAALPFRNPVLRAFANTVWHCSNAAEVMLALNDARAST
jgi:hypothetical protein